MANGSRRDRDDFDDEPRPRRRSEFDDDPGYSSSRPPRSKGVNVLGVIALVVGLIGLLLSLIPCVGVIGIPVAAIGLICGFISLFVQRETTGRGMPIAGTIVSLVGVIISSLWLLLWVGAASKSKDMADQMRVQMEDAQRRADQAAKDAEEQRKKEEKELRDGKAITVTAQKLDKDYSDNAIGADSKYKGKLLEVTGTVERVDRDRFGKPWIELKTDSDAIMRCEFPKEAQADLGKVEAGKAVTIRGRCKGKSKTRDGDQEIVLENCILVRSK
jgi:hypothetical protein